MSVSNLQAVPEDQQQICVPGHAAQHLTNSIDPCPSRKTYSVYVALPRATVLNCTCAGRSVQLAVADKQATATRLKFAFAVTALSCGMQPPTLRATHAFMWDPLLVSKRSKCCRCMCIALCSRSVQACQPTFTAQCNTNLLCISVAYPAKELCRAKHLI